jgi:hypothetical protein
MMTPFGLKRNDHFNKHNQSNFSIFDFKAKN